MTRWVSNNTLDPMGHSLNRQRYQKKVCGSEPLSVPRRRSSREALQISRRLREVQDEALSSWHLPDAIPDLSYPEPVEGRTLAIQLVG
jgi:hypothetical protein